MNSAADVLNFQNVLKNAGYEGSTQAVHHYWQLLREGNQVQNLSGKSDGLEEFIQNHLLDCLELLKTRWIQGLPRVDLGSGCGVPGLLTAAIEGAELKEPWFLLESELRKAEFLETTTSALGLQDRVSVKGVRAETWLRKANQDQPLCIVSRAVGKVAGLYTLLSPCSTWNTLVLFKSRGWAKEWEETPSSIKKKLSIKDQIEYSIEDQGESKYRTILLLARS